MFNTITSVVNLILTFETMFGRVANSVLTLTESEFGYLTSNSSGVNLDLSTEQRFVFYVKDAPKPLLTILLGSQ